MGLVFILSLFTAIFFLSIQRGQCAHIEGGKESIPHSRPFMAAISYGENFGCGGSLINEKWVLTAAHCFPPARTFVVLGAHKQGNKPELGRQAINIANMFVYPGYNLGTFEHDLMLLKLKKKARFSKYVKPVQLPRTSDDVQPGTNCLVAGWGDTRFRGKSSATLREVNLTVIDRKVCNDEYHYNGPAVKDNMLCAGDKRGGKASCQGDSGGPLICGVEQRGIVSFAVGCASKKYPIVFTRLTKAYISWIKKTMKDNP